MCALAAWSRSIQCSSLRIRAFSRCPRRLLSADTAHRAIIHLINCNGLCSCKWSAIAHLFCIIGSGWDHRQDTQDWLNYGMRNRDRRMHSRFQLQCDDPSLAADVAGDRDCCRLECHTAMSALARAHTCVGIDPTQRRAITARKRSVATAAAA